MSDRVMELRAELDALGYHVIKKDWVRKIGNQQIVSDRAWHEADDNMRHRIEQHTRESLGRAMGQYLIESGAVRFGMTTEVNIGRVYRVETSIILRDPQFDKPEWLR